MNSNKHEILVNNAAAGNYIKQSDVEGVIRYVVRQNKSPKEDLVCWGGLGITEFSNVETIIQQFKAVHKLHCRNGSFGRYIDHEEYSFFHETEQALYAANADLDDLARQMAYDFYNNDHCQVIYAVHRPKEESKHLHFHFAINTVNYLNGNKRRENFKDNKARSERFNKMVRETIGEP